jgi:hypothetical protein
MQFVTAIVTHEKVRWYEHTGTVSGRTRDDFKVVEYAVVERLDLIDGRTRQRRRLINQVLLKSLQRTCLAKSDDLNFTQAILYTTGQSVLLREPIHEWPKTDTLHMPGQDDPEPAALCR